MLVRLGQSFIAVIWFVGLLPTVHGEPVPTDATGDPLPTGVVARLGTGRLFHPHSHFAFSPDDKLLASSGGGLLRLWDVPSGKELRHIELPSPKFNINVTMPPAFSPDGKLVALSCADRTVHVWETDTGKDRYQFEALQGPGEQLLFDPDGRRLALAGSGGPVRVWDLKQKKLVGEFGDQVSSYFVAFSADGTTLTAVSRGGGPGLEKKVLCVWDGASGKELRRRAFETEGKFMHALSPDGTLYATPTADGAAVCLLDLATGKERCRTEGEIKPARVVQFTADGKSLVTGGEDGIVHFWATDKGKRLRQFKALSTGLQAIAVAHDGKLVAVAGRADNALHLFEVATGKELHAFAGHRSGGLKVAFAADGKSVFTCGGDGLSRTMPALEWPDWSLRQWDPRTGKELRVTSADLGGEVYWSCFSADAGLLATVTHDGTLRLWDTAAGKELRKWQMPTQQHNLGAGRTAQSPAIQSLAFAADARSLLANDGTQLRRWDVATGDEKAALNLPQPVAYSPCVPSPDGRTVLLVEGGRPRRMHLLDLGGKADPRPLGPGLNQTIAGVFSPDGRTVAAVDVQRAPGLTTIALWEAASGKRRGSVPVANAYGVLAFSPDGTLLAGGNGKGLSLHHVASGREVAALESDLGVQSIAFSPDGKLLAAAGWSNTVLIYDVAALTEGKLPKATRPAAKELDALLTDLAGADGVKAYQAIALLAAAPAESLPLLKERLAIRPDADAKALAQLVADLDDNSFEVREKASAELAKLGGKAEAALTRALENTKSAEVRKRARRLLDKLAEVELPSQELIRLRSLEVVEQAGTSEARDLLRELAKGDADDRLTQEAKAALKRLERR